MPDRTPREAIALSLARRGDEGTRRRPQERYSLTGREQLRAHECAIDEQRQLPRELARTFDAQTFGDAFEAPPQLLLMRRGHLAGRVLGVRKFGGDIELRAAAIIRPPDALADPCEMCLELGGRIALMALGDAV